MNNGEQPAFPEPFLPHDGGLALSVHPGLTKREYFAALAMQGLLANPELFKIASEQKPDVSLDIYSKAAIEHADDILKQLEQ